MNTALVEYGITTEQSDLRAHVCPRERMIYVFPTAAGVAAIETERYPLSDAHQKGTAIVTAQGCWVPPDDIESCLRISPRAATWDAMRFTEGDSAFEKGRKAAMLVYLMIRNGLFPGSLGSEYVTDADVQRQGMDIVIGAVTLPKRTIEVKCDYAGGSRGLYLQTRECNPFGIH